MFGKMKAALLGLLFTALSIGGASAAIDVTSVTTGVTDAGAAITTVGVAILGVCVLIAAYMWVRKPIK